MIWWGRRILLKFSCLYTDAGRGIRVWVHVTLQCAGDTTRRHESHSKTRPGLLYRGVFPHVICEYFIAVVTHISRSGVVELPLGHTGVFDIEHPTQGIERQLQEDYCTICVKPRHLGIAHLWEGQSAGWRPSGSRPCTELMGLSFHNGEKYSHDLLISTGKAARALDGDKENMGA